MPPAWRERPRASSEIANAGGTDTDEHFDELRTRYREEGDASFASDRAGKQGFAGPGGTDKEDSFGSTGAKAAEGFWILEEGNDFLKFEFRFIDAGHVLESDFRVGFDEDFRARFANGHEAAETLPAGKFAEEEKPKEINNGGNRPGQDGADKACMRRSRNLDAFGGELIGDRRIDPDCHKFVFAVRPWLLEPCLQSYRSR